MAESSHAGRLARAGGLVVREGIWKDLKRLELSI